MELTAEHFDVLRIVAQAQTDDTVPSTTIVGRELLDAWRQRGGPYAWQDSSPWRGTEPYAQELSVGGLLEIRYSVAKFRHWDQPAETPREYWLAITDRGRQALANSSDS